MSSNEKQKGWSLRLGMRHALPLEHETSLFILASALDVFMTYLLLKRGDFVESNPIAQTIFLRWDIQGMVVFKFVFVAIVCIIAQVIARRRLKTARWLLRFLTLIVSGVVVYAFVLLMKRPDAALSLAW